MIKWIPGDRPNDYNKCFLVTTQTNNGRKVHRFYYSGSMGWSRKGRKGEIIAWAEMPVPYNGRNRSQWNRIDNDEPQGQPEKMNVPYLVTVKSGRRRTVYEATFRSGIYPGEGYWAMKKNIVAWAKIPEPYAE